MRTSILRVLALKWIADPVLRDDLRRFATDCQKQNDPRDEYVQGLWVRPAMDPARLGLMVRKPGESNVNPEFKPVPIVEMKKIAAELKALQERALALTARMKGQV